MNQPSSFGTLARKSLAAAALILTASAGCEKETPIQQQECPSDDSVRLRGELQATKSRLEETLAASEKQKGELEACRAEAAATAAAAALPKSETPAAQEDSAEKERITEETVRANVADAMEKVGVKEENKKLIEIVVTKMLVSRFGLESIDYYNLESVFGGDIKVQVVPLARRTTVQSVSADFLKTLGELSVEDKMKIMKSMVGVMPETLTAAEKFSKYETLFKKRIFDVCPDLSSVDDVVDDTDRPECKTNPLVAQYHNEEGFHKAVMRLMWQMGISFDSLKKAKDAATDSLRENGLGL